jgi:cysteine desulfurase/selenocysteine lyase
VNPALLQQFPGISGCTYLNTAAESAFMASHEEALMRYATQKTRGEPGRVALQDVESRCRELAARLLHVSPAEIAFLASTARGMDVALKSIRWQPGENVVLTDLDYPTNGFAAQLLQEQGVEMRVLTTVGRVDLDALDSLIDNRTRAVMISLVSFKTGFAFDLEAVSRCVRRKGALLVVDAVPAAGVLPIHAEQCDFLSAGTYKWLLGPHGLSIFYVNRRLLPDVVPPYVAWRGVTDIFDPLRFERYELLPDARRFEEGMPNYLGLMCLENALAFLLDQGDEQIVAHVEPIVSRTYDGLIELGITPLTPAAPRERAGIISFSAPRCAEIAGRLKEQDIYVWGKDSRIRISAHVYNDMDDVEHLLSGLADLRELLVPADR